MLSQGGRGGRKLPILLSKKTPKRGGWSEKSSIEKNSLKKSSKNFVRKFVKKFVK